MPFPMWSLPPLLSPCLSLSLIFVCLRVSLPSFLSARLLSHSCLAPPSLSLVWLPHTPFVLLACSASLLCANSSQLPPTQRIPRPLPSPPLLIQLLRTKEGPLSQPLRHAAWLMPTPGMCLRVPSLWVQHLGRDCPGLEGTVPACTTTTLPPQVSLKNPWR